MLSSSYYHIWILFSDRKIPFGGFFSNKKLLKRRPSAQNGVTCAKVMIMTLDWIPYAIAVSNFCRNRILICQSEIFWSVPMMHSVTWDISITQRKLRQSPRKNPAPIHWLSTKSIRSLKFTPLTIYSSIEFTPNSLHTTTSAFPLLFQSFETLKSLLFCYF